MEYAPFFTFSFWVFFLINVVIIRYVINSPWIYIRENRYIVLYHEYFTLFYFYFNLFRCLAADVCKDVSFSECPIKTAHKIKKGIQTDVTSCQSACAYKQNCNYFRFTEYGIHKCSFLEEDYRQDCNVFAAPVVRILHKKFQKILNSWSKTT